jgi:hypothetical protein
MCLLIIGVGATVGYGVGGIASQPLASTIIVVEENATARR